MRIWTKIQCHTNRFMTHFSKVFVVFNEVSVFLNTLIRIPDRKMYTVVKLFYPRTLAIQIYFIWEQKKAVILHQQFLCDEPKQHWNYFVIFMMSPEWITSTYIYALIQIISSFQPGAYYMRNTTHIRLPICQPFLIFC